MNRVKWLIFGMGIALGGIITTPVLGQEKASVNLWDSTNNWRIYAVYNKTAFGFSLDTLKNFKSEPLNDDSMSIFLSKARPLAITYPVWMGYYIASCRFPDGRLGKIVISMYGGFLLDQLNGKYYELPLDLRKDWLSYLSDSYQKLELSKR